MPAELAPQVVALHHFHRQRKAALFARLHRADTDYLTADLLATVVADHHDHGVFPWAGAIGGMLHRAFHAQWSSYLRGAQCRQCGFVEAQVVLARRTDRRTFQNDRLAMRAYAGRAFEQARPRIFEAMYRFWCERLPPA